MEKTERIYLNLGKVGDIATVKLNDKEVGVFWKPPYMADVTNYVRKGANTLEVFVTNLWINRIIGDEQLPVQDRRTHTNLSNITGRYSFERFSGPESDQFLRVSGLVGPVTIRFSSLYEF